MLKTVSAGILKAPPKMVDAIYALAMKEWTGFILWFVERELPKAEEELQRLAPEPGSAIPPPKFSPAVWKLYNKAVDDMISTFESGAWKEEYSRDRKVQDARDFAAAQGGVRHASYDKFERALATFQPQKAIKQLQGLRVKTLVGIDDEADLRTIRDVLYTIRSVAARKASLGVQDFIKSLRRGSGAAAPDSMLGSSLHDAQTKNARKTVEMLRAIKAELARMGVKKSRYKPSPSRAVSHVVPVDLTGLPKSYPIDAWTAGHFASITLEIVPARASFAGAWNGAQREMVLMLAKFPMSVESFRSSARDLRETIEHELRHLTQTVINESLQYRAQQKIGHGPLPKGRSWERGGTPYQSTPPNLEKQGIVDRDDLYFLDPREFFPQISSSVQRLIESVIFPYFEHTKVPSIMEFQADAKNLWLEHVGARSGRRIVDPFYAALKKHNPRMWKRATGEGWAVLNERLAKMAAEHLNPKM